MWDKCTINRQELSIFRRLLLTSTQPSWLIFIYRILFTNYALTKPQYKSGFRFSFLYRKPTFLLISRTRIHVVGTRCLPGVYNETLVVQIKLILTNQGPQRCRCKTKFRWKLFYHLSGSSRMCFIKLLRKFDVSDVRENTEMYNYLLFPADPMYVLYGTMCNIYTSARCMKQDNYEGVSL